MKWEKLFTLYITKGSFLSPVYKELLKIEGQRTENSVDKENDGNRQFTKKDTKMALKH